jgi:Cu/Ag efflux pump CusA
MAQVILGGLATSTVICLILLPPLILVYRHRGYHAADDSASVTTGA